MDTTQPFGLVHGRINLGVGDDADTGRAPNLVGLNGKAVFTATVDKYLITTPGSEMIIIPSSISADVVNGALQWLGQDDVPLVANLDSAGRSLGWQWAVAFTLNNAASQPVNVIGWRLDVGVYDGNAAPVNGVNPTITQLTAQAPVVSNSVVTLAKGDPGAVTDLQIGSVTTGSPAATITGAAPTKFLNLVLPSAGAGGTVTTVNTKSPDGAGAVMIGAADVNAVPTTDKGAANGVATLDSSGLIPAAQLPAIAISDFLGASANQAAMLAKTGQKGDWTTRTDSSTTWLITGVDPTQLSSWTQIVSPAGAVSSVNGRTGAVSTSSADITDATTVGKSVLTAADAAAVRAATGAGTYTKPGTGIPATDLSSAAQTSLGKADGSVQQTEHMVYIRRWTGSAWEIRGTIPSGSEVEWQSPVSVGPPPVDGTYALGGVDSYVGE